MQPERKRQKTSPASLFVVGDVQHGDDDAVVGRKAQLIELPAECTWEVLGWLGVVDLVRATAVCRSWRSLAMSPHATTSAFPDRDSLYHHGHTVTSSSSGDAVRGRGGGRLWERAYFRTWPLPQLPPLPTTGLPPTKRCRHGDDDKNCRCNHPLVLFDVSPHAQPQQQLNWMDVTKERLRLQCKADRTKAPAIVRAQVLARVLAEEGWEDESGGWTQLEALGKALKAAIRTVRRRDKSVRLVKETIKVPYHGCDELTKALFKGLLPCAFLFNTRCKGTRCDGEITYKSNLVVYSLTTGLPLYCTFRRASDPSYAEPEATSALSVSMRGLPRPPPLAEHDDGEDGDEEDEQDCDNAVEQAELDRDQLASLHAGTGRRTVNDKLAMFARMLAFLFGAERVRWLPSETAGAVFCSMLGHVRLYGLDSVTRIDSLAVALPR